MALIEIYHVVADMYPIADDQTIREGMCVNLNANSQIELANVAGERCIGIAGDSTALSANASNLSTPYSSNLTLGANGANRSWTQNRVSDLAGNETLASNMITVYNGGGKFATDQYSATITTWTPMAPLYTDANGQLSTTAGANVQVGVLTQGPSAYPSGVPGTDVTGSISLGDFITFVLTI